MPHSFLSLISRVINLSPFFPIMRIVRVPFGDSPAAGFFLSFLRSKLSMIFGLAILPSRFLSSLVKTVLNSSSNLDSDSPGTSSYSSNGILGFCSLFACCLVGVSAVLFCRKDLSSSSSLSYFFLPCCFYLISQSTSLTVSKNWSMSWLVSLST